jgi:Mn-containing catalase
MGGRFGEMSTFMNYTFQSFNFRNKKGARPFYDLVANIAAEEFGHIELVAATINTMLTGASPTTNGDGSIDGAMAGLRTRATRSSSSPAATRRCRRTRTDGRGPETTSSPRAT